MPADLFQTLYADPLFTGVLANIIYAFFTGTAAWALDRVLGDPFTRAMNATLKAISARHRVSEKDLAQAMKNPAVVDEMGQYALGHEFNPAVLVSAVRVLPGVGAQIDEAAAKALVVDLFAVLRDQILRDPTLAHYYQTRLLERIAARLAPPPGHAPAVDQAGLDALAQQAVAYHTCFMSYSSKDQEFASQLYGDLKEAGVDIWFDVEDMPWSQRIRVAMDQAVLGRNKLLVIYSKDSIASDYVEQEVERAQLKERREKRLVLFPIRIDGAVMSDDLLGVHGYVKLTRVIGDFTRWRDDDAYKAALHRLLRNLRATWGV